MPDAWKTVRVFISSTFRDMQAERDHLVRFVFPKLRQELLQRRIHLVDVDLRWGVTSEQDALSVCREIVDECRPRFLCMLGGRYGWVPPDRTRSITADEVHYGVLDRDQTSRGLAYFYFRDPSATAAMVEVAPGEFREPAGSHGDVALAELKTAVVESGVQPFIYRAQWDDQSRRLIGLKELGDRVYVDLKQSIDQEFGPTTGEKPDEFTEEKAAMEAFIEESVQRFVLGSRQPVWNELQQHAERTGGNGYLCLTGEAGSGKSALLGKFCQDYRATHPQDLVIPHFAGASPASTDVRRTLRRLCHELAIGTELTAEIPEDPEKLRDAFAEILQQASAQKRVVILLDAINQFDPTTQLAGYSWLPEELPAKTRIILSTLSGPGLESLRQRRQPPLPVELRPLDAPDRQAIIREFLHRYRKSMTDDQRAALLAKADAGTPLYLLVALEELRTLGTYEEITDRIAQLPPDTRALFIWILKRLQDDDGFRDASGRKIGQELVSRFVSLLGASRHGLSQQELLELLSPGDPRGNVAALAQLLRPYLMQRGELLDFYHGQFREAVEQAYLESDNKKCKAHSELAEYFHAQDYWRESLEDQRKRAKKLPPTPRPVNERKVNEIPWQRARVAQLSGQWDELERLFTTLSFLEAKAEAGLIFTLASDFSEALAITPAARPRHRILCLLEEGVRCDIHFIARHPTTLFQCLWNSGWWYDCAAAGGYYAPPRVGWGPEGPPWIRPGEKLADLLERWRADREKAETGTALVRSLRPPEAHLGATGEIVLSAHAGDASCLAVSPEGNRLAMGYKRGPIRIWDMASGRPVLSLDSSSVSCMAFSSDSSCLVSGANRIADLWNLEDGRNMLRVACPGAIHAVAFSQEGSQLLLAYEEEEYRVSVGVQLWDVATGKMLPLPETKRSASKVVFTRTGRPLMYGVFLGGPGRTEGWLIDLATGAELEWAKGHLGSAFSDDGARWMSTRIEDHSVSVWDIGNGQRLASLVGHSHYLSGAALSRDGRRAVTGSWDGTVRVWDVSTGAEVWQLTQYDGASGLAFVSDTRIAFLCGDSTARVHDFTRPVRQAILTAHDNVSRVSFSPDGAWFATWSQMRKGITADYTESKTEAIVWSTASGTPRLELRPPGTEVQCFAFSPSPGLLGTGGADGVVRIWDLVRGVELRSCVGHGKSVDGLQFSADGRRLVSASGDGTVRVWDVASGRSLLCLAGHEDKVWPAAFSPDGARIVSGSGDLDYTARVWDATTGAHLQTLRGHELEVLAVAFSHDGRRIATSAYDSTVRIWDAATGHPLACLFHEEAYVSQVAFSHDDPDVVFGVGIDTVMSWRIRTEQVIEIFGPRTDPSTFTSRQLRAVHRGAGTVIEQRDEETPIAWFPVTFRCMAQHPSGRIWAGATRDQVYLIELEGPDSLFSVKTG